MIQCQGMEQLILQAFRNVENFSEQVAAGHFDLVGPEGDIILPGTWESCVEPNTQIVMYMWEIAKEELDPKKGQDEAPDLPPAPPAAPPRRRNSNRKSGGTGLSGFLFGQKSKKADKPRNKPKRDADGPLVEVISDPTPPLGGGVQIVEAPDVPKSNTKAKRRNGMNQGGFVRKK